MLIDPGSWYLDHLVREQKEIDGRKNYFIWANIIRNTEDITRLHKYRRVFSALPQFSFVSTIVNMIDDRISIYELYIKENTRYLVNGNLVRPSAPPVSQEKT
jgi:hypothetical protein